MIVLLLLAVWTAVFLLAGLTVARIVKSRARVYLLILISCAYLSGAFSLVPLIRKFLGLM